MSGQAPPAIRRPASDRIHVAPPKDVKVLLDDALFHLENVIHSVETARRALKGDAANRLRIRARTLRSERHRIELFMQRHRMTPRTTGTGPK